MTKNSTGFAAALLFAVLAGKVCAETVSQPSLGASAIIVPQQAPPAGPSVFDLEKAPPPATSKGSTSGVERYTERQSEFNTAQREEWIVACEAEKKKSMEDFRRCFEEHRKQASAQLQQKFDAVEKNLRQPSGGRSFPKPESLPE